MSASSSRKRINTRDYPLRSKLPRKLHASSESAPAKPKTSTKGIAEPRKQRHDEKKAKRKTSAAQKRRELRESIAKPVLTPPAKETSSVRAVGSSLLEGVTFSTSSSSSSSAASGFVTASELHAATTSKNASLSSTSSLSQTDLLMSSWSLPDAVLKKYRDFGIVSMFEWQAECLQKTKALQGRNLVYSAPTSAGKTLVSELLILKRVLETEQKAIFILPFVSITMEKTAYLKNLFRGVGLTVEAFVGTQSPKGGLARCDIAVCTIEKANSMINRLVEEKELSQLGVVVVDELHMAGDPSRGYLLELLLTKIRFVCMQSPNPIQIVGMSATLPNLITLASWLDAELYNTHYRPVPLTEYIKVGNAIYDKEMEMIRDLDAGNDDPDGVIALCRETVTAGQSVLVFCPTKIQCENLALNISRKLSSDNPDKVDDVLKQLKNTPVGLDPRLAVIVSQGVAFHHAGLTMDERRVIETGFRQYALRVVVATSTLSSGVNLPARRVIIRTPIFHGRLLDTMTYKQMTGRAGRKGVDTSGESVLVCKETERAKGMSLVQSTLTPVKSCLLDDDGAMKRALLEVIAGGVALTPDDVETYTSCTLLAAERKALGCDVDAVKKIVADSLVYLQKNEFIFLRYSGGGDDRESYQPTQFGAACLASALSPEEACVVLKELQCARKGFVLENELHLVYQVTPIFLQRQWPNPNWYQFLRLWEKLPPDMRRVADRVGVEESFLARAVYGRITERDAQQKAVADVHRRFFMAMALNELVHEAPLGAVAERYGVARGPLQSLQQSAATFAGMVTIFCQRLNWKNMELLLSQFQSRLCFGVERELCELIQISLLNGQRARTLYNAGYRTLASIALASPVEIETTLRKVTPFMSAKDDERSWSWVNQLQVKMTEAEAASEIVREARELVLSDNVNIDAAAATGSASDDEEKAASIPTTALATSEAEPLNAAVASPGDGISPQDPDSTCDLFGAKTVSVAHSSPASTSAAASFSVSTPAFATTRPSRRWRNVVEFGSPILPVTPDGAVGRRSFSMPEFSFETLELMAAACHEAEKSSQKKTTREIAVESSHALSQSSIGGGSTFSIIDVAAHKDLFETFLSEWKGQKRCSVALASSRLVGSSNIGTRRQRAQQQKLGAESTGYSAPDGSEVILGMAVCWQPRDAYFVSFAPCSSSPPSSQSGDSLAEAGVDPELSQSQRLSAVAAVLREASTCPVRILFGVKTQLKKLAQTCGVSLSGVLRDPNVGDWLLQPDGKEKNLHQLLKHYLSEEFDRRKGEGLAFMATNPGPARLKACAEAVLLLPLMDSLEVQLDQNGLIEAFHEVEMPAVVSLAQMEMHGLGFSAKEYKRQSGILHERLSSLEVEAHQLAGRQFSLNNPEDVSTVLFHELKLPPPDPSGGGKKVMGLGRIRRLRQFSTAKGVLEKLATEHHLPGVILEWRRVENAVTKTLLPLAKERQRDRAENRVFATCQTHTATGRIAVCDPNLQNVPKEFDIGCDTRKICMRDMFVASPGCVLVAADYCQLELRLIAHLSKDEKLIQIFSRAGDVFRSIASEWVGVGVDDVTADQRQWTKQICYGMIYGIGAKGLAEQLGVKEEEAARFMTSFKSKYEGLESFLRSSVDRCRELGYVETLMGRRRYLPAIKSTNANERSQAERQAVNSTVQGSAADLVKQAMINVDAVILNEGLKDDASLVLHMHDELVYDVRQEVVTKLGRILRREMEGAVAITIPLPVKLNFGRRWGSMETLELQ